MANNDFIRGYKQGYEAGKKLSSYALSTDIQFIAGNIALILHEKGWERDEIVELIEEMQRRWASGDTPEEIQNRVYETCDIDLKVV